MKLRPHISDVIVGKGQEVYSCFLRMVLRIGPEPISTGG